MEDFAKIFKSPKYGCILVERVTNIDGHAQVRFTYRVKADDFVTASACLTYPNIHSGAENADLALSYATLANAETMIAAIEETIDEEDTVWTA